MSDQDKNGFKVEFKKSGLTAHWNLNVETLLELYYVAETSVEYVVFCRTNGR